MALSKKQARIAKAAPPFNRITGADFKVLKKIKSLSKRGRKKT